MLQMTPLADILPVAEQLTKEQIEGYIRERSEARAALSAEMAQLVPFRDKRWKEHIEATAGAKTLAQELNLRRRVVNIG